MKEKAQKIGKRLLQFGLILLAIVIGLKMIGASPSKKGGGDSLPAGDPLAWDLSQRREPLISEVKELPPASERKWVTLSLPCYKVDNGTMWYQVTASPNVEVEYDFLDGKPLRKDGPSEMLAVKRWPPVIKIRAIGKGGKIELTLNRQFLPDGPAEKVKKEKKHFVKEHVVQHEDPPASVQMM